MCSTILFHLGMPWLTMQPEKMSSQFCLRKAFLLCAINLASFNNGAFLQEATDVKEHRLWHHHRCKNVNCFLDHKSGRIVVPLSLCFALLCFAHIYLSGTCEQRGDVPDSVMNRCASGLVLWEALHAVFLTAPPRGTRRSITVSMSFPSRTFHKTL